MWVFLGGFFRWVYPKKTHRVFWGTYPGVWTLCVCVCVMSAESRSSWQGRAFPCLPAHHPTVSEPRRRRSHRRRTLRWDLRRDADPTPRQVPRRPLVRRARIGSSAGPVRSQLSHHSGLVYVSFTQGWKKSWFLIKNRKNQIFFI